LADLLIKLYDLPALHPVSDLRVRPAAAYEKHLVVEFVRSHFSEGWASECDVAFSNRPISCHVATQDNVIVGFACYDTMRLGFFGPLGVLEAARRQGAGRLLLLSCLQVMQAHGYGYAIVGHASCPGFYVSTVAAIPIPGSTPGVYEDRLKGI
jgi:hypothetical protein